MNSELRNSHATLTPSELAALLGPQTAPALESPPIQSPEAGWTQFADKFARALTARLRPLIRAATRVTSIGSRTLTAEAVTTVHNTRSVVSVWQSNGSLEPIAVVLSPALVATFVDRLLGGRSAPNCEQPDQHRPLTDVDHRLAARLTDAIRLSVIEQVAMDSTLELTELLSDATSFADAWLPDCSLLRLSFELRFVQGGGALDLLLPLEFAEAFADEPIAEAECLTTSSSQQRAESTATSSRRSTVIVQLAQTSLSQSDLQALTIGDVILMDLATDQSLRVLVDGRLRFHATAGTSDGRKATRLTNAASVP